jgi:tetratricopeptide (TPR) repeat protein
MPPNISARQWTALKIVAAPHMHAIAQSNSAWVELLTGQFRKAEEKLKTTLSSTSHVGTSIGTLDLLARVYLAQGQLDKCEEVLGPVMSDRPVHYSTYETRWAALTRAKLLYRRGRLNDALTWLKAVEHAQNENHDRHFAASCHLLTAYLLGQTDNAEQCARQVILAEALGATQNRELQAQFNYSVGGIIGADSPSFAKSLQQRGKRIWAMQGIVSASLELDGPIDDKLVNRTRTAVSRGGDSARTVLSAVASLFDVAYSPAAHGGRTGEYPFIGWRRSRTRYRIHRRCLRICALNNEFAGGTAFQRKNNRCYVRDPNKSVRRGNTL